MSEISSICFLHTVIISLHAGVFLHVLADTLGSVGVIISAILIHQFGKISFYDLELCIIVCYTYSENYPNFLILNFSNLSVTRPHSRALNFTPDLSNFQVFLTNFCLKNLDSALI